MLPTRVAASLLTMVMVACGSGPTGSGDLSQLADAATRALGDYTLVAAIDGAGEGLAVDTARVAARATGADCDPAANAPFAATIGVDGSLTLSQADRAVAVAITSYGTRCNDSTFVFTGAFVGQFVLQERYLTLTVGAPGNFGQVVLGAYDPDANEITLDFGPGGLQVFGTFGGSVQQIFLTRATFQRRSS